MGWQERQYAREDYGAQGPRRPLFRGPGMGALSVSTTILLANIAVYFLMFSSAWGERIINFQSSLGRFLCFWKNLVWVPIT